ncbi:MAG: HAD family hydrolase [Candidatus Bathyarchaeota archaeon]|nr:HAD family hydrolase [Candidatus Bathyarchaeota archaeon]
MIDTIFFDNWNTLVQAPDLMKRGGSTERFHRYLMMQGIEIPYNRFVDVYRPISAKQRKEADADGYRELDYHTRLELVFTEIGLSDVKTHAARAWKAYLDEWTVLTEFFPETQGVLAALRGKYKLGVITNYMHGPTCRDVFDKLGYEDIFDSLIVSEEVGYRKPAKIIFEEALRDIDSKPETCVMVGDMYDADIVGANGIGMRSVLIDVYDNQQAHYHEATVAIKSIGEFPLALDKLTRS